MSRRWSGVAQATGLREIEAARQVEAPIGFRPVWMINVTGTVLSTCTSVLRVGSG
jgi:hypothetical protein